MAKPSAGALIETLLPFFDRLRFYPVPHPLPIRSRAAVSVQTAGAAREALQKKPFPQTILPNPLVEELRALATASDLSLPFLDELAEDIFMGAFAENFLRAARHAARMLRGTLYERYYDLPYDRVLALDDVERQRGGTPVSPGFARLCEKLAGAPVGGRRSPARNGTIIEQAQILTTHNLAVLFADAGLRETLGPRLPDLAREVFAWVCRKQQLTIRDWRARLQMVKNTAYGWRQMLFFLSLLSRAEQAAFESWSIAYLGEQRTEFVQRFQPVVAGLRATVHGERFDAEGQHVGSGGRRFLGWSQGRHWLLAGPSQ